MSEQNTHREAAVQQQQAAAQPRNLNAELQVLAKFGGFNVLESSVDGIQNLNPERKARLTFSLQTPNGRLSARSWKNGSKCGWTCCKATSPSAK